MSRQANTPFWRTAGTLAFLFWTGVALAPLAALVLLLGTSDGTIKLALVLGMASVVLIGLSVTWRRDAESVAADLSEAMAEVEANTHHAVSELRAELRHLSVAEAPGHRMRDREPVGPPHARNAERPQPRAMHHQDTPPRGFHHEHEEPPSRAHRQDTPPRGYRPHDDREGYAPSPPRRSTVDHDPLVSTDPMPRQSRPAPAYAPPVQGEQRRRREAAMEETGEMVRVTESVSVTRRETTTMRPFDPQYQYNQDQPMNEPGVYRSQPAKSGISEKFSKLKMPKMPTMGRRDDDHNPDVRAEADSLLSGLAAEPGHEDDWAGGRHDPIVPRQRDREYDHLGGGRHHEDYDRPQGRHSEPVSGGWRTQERSAELRMGMRETRSVSEDGWRSEEGYGRQGADSGGWGPTPGRGRHSTPEDYSAPRAISDSEADPQPRWSERSQPRSQGGGSYMDQHYGERDRRR